MDKQEMIILYNICSRYLDNQSDTERKKFFNELKQENKKYNWFQSIE